MATSAARGRDRGQDRHGATCCAGAGRSAGRAATRESSPPPPAPRSGTADPRSPRHRCRTRSGDCGRPGRIPAPDPQATPSTKRSNPMPAVEAGLPAIWSRATVAIPTAQPVKRLADHRHKLHFSTTPVLEKRPQAGFFVTPCCQGAFFFRRIADRRYRRGGPAPLPAPWFPVFGTSRTTRRAFQNTSMGLTAAPLSRRSAPSTLC